MQIYKTGERQPDHLLRDPLRLGEIGARAAVLPAVEGERDGRNAEERPLEGRRGECTM